MRLSTICHSPQWILGAAILVAGCTSIGCQVDVGGQTLPSPYYMQDDIQYFDPGPEFKLSREAAALQTYGAEPVPGEPI